MSRRKPTVVSLFAGAGGSSQGYKQAGAKVRLAVEWDERAAESYRLNFPRTPIHVGDVTELTGDQALDLAGLEPGELDLLDGSPPCQGFSISGRRHLTDPRNQLFREFVRLLQTFQPRGFIMENVAGMARGKMKAVLNECLEEFRSSGYRVKAGIVTASWYGVPQKRQRLIVTGTREDLNRDPVLAPPRTKPVTAGSALIGVQNQTFHSGLSDLALEIWRATPANSLPPKAEFLGGRFFNFRKLDPRKPSPTIIATVEITHWEEARYLTIEELKRLQGFPDDFQLIGSYGTRYKQIGNSVPPPLTQAIAEDLLKALGPA